MMEALNLVSFLSPYPICYNDHPSFEAQSSYLTSIAALGDVLEQTWRYPSVEQVFTINLEGFHSSFTEDTHRIIDGSRTLQTFNTSFLFDASWMFEYCLGNRLFEKVSIPAEQRWENLEILSLTSSEMNSTSPQRITQLVFAAGQLALADMPKLKRFQLWYSDSDQTTLLRFEIDITGISVCWRGTCDMPNLETWVDSWQPTLILQNIPIPANFSYFPMEPWKGVGRKSQQTQCKVRYEVTKIDKGFIKSRGDAIHLLGFEDGVCP